MKFWLPHREIAPEPVAHLSHMKGDVLAATAICLAWRIASYAWLNLAEDSALLAMMFS